LTDAVQQPLRNVIHLATGLAALWVVMAPDPWMRSGIVAMVIVALLIDLSRVTLGRAWLDRLLPGVYRDPEPLGLSGATLLTVGYLATVWLFPPQAAAAGILALAAGDPAAAAVGRWYGARTKRPGKTWAGSVACFVACVPVLWLLPPFGLPAAAAGGAMAALVERRAGPLDNVLVPVAVAMLLNLWVV
jgi:dolichol kinase